MFPSTPARASQLLCGAAVALCLQAPTARAVGEYELRSLYANRFTFDRRRIPLIAVRIMEGQTRVTVTCRKGLLLQPFGTAAATLAGARTWTITLRNGRPARVRHWVVLERLLGPNTRSRRQKAQRRWRGRRLEVRTIEVGALFAVGGRVVDNRTTLVVTRPDPNPKVVRLSARKLERLLGVRTTIHEELLRRPTGTIVARAGRRGLVLSNPGAIWFAPLGGGAITVKRVEYGRGYRWHGHKDRRYFGRVYLAVDRRGKLAVVNEVPADQLLAGLVPAEIFTSAPAEALKAQSVAARGQLLAKIGARHAVDPYLVCSAQHCQVYSGAGSEHPRTTSAVVSTRGQILVDRSGRLADTVYSASCGGFTESNEHVWGTPPNPNLRGHLDASVIGAKGLGRFAKGITSHNIGAWLRARPRCWCSRTTFGAKGKFRWRRRLTGARLDRLVNASFRVGHVKTMKVVSRGLSGRATSLLVKGSKGRVIVRGELVIRRLLGNLNSSMFLVQRLVRAAGKTDFIILGGGWGHGVGMCQTGAIGMAQAGRKAKQILSHYYRGTRLLRLY